MADFGPLYLSLLHPHLLKQLKRLIVRALHPKEEDEAKLERLANQVWTLVGESDLPNGSLRNLYLFLFHIY